MSWLFDALIAMVLFSIIGILYKVINIPETELFFLISIFSGMILGFILGIKGSELEIGDYSNISLICLAGIVFAFGQIFAIRAIKKMDRNPGISMLVINLNFLLVYLLSIPLFGARPSIKEIFGIIFAIISFILITI